MMNMQTQQNQLEWIEQQCYTTALSLPQPEVPIFRGQPIEYCSFICEFENLIESKTDSSSLQLYYLVQYTAGDVQELMHSCLAMNPDKGYQEARRLMKEKHGQNYKITTAYVDRLTNGPPIRSEDGNALQKFSVQLTSCNCKNNNSSKHRNRSGSGTPKGSSFGIDAEFKQSSLPPGTSNVKCLSCSHNHRLFQCSDFGKKTLEERLQFLRKKGLCNNCFARGHLAKTCDMPSLCRVKDCNFKHSTFLHPKAGNAYEKRDHATEPLESVNPKGNNQDRPQETVVQSAYVDTREDSRS